MTKMAPLINRKGMLTNKFGIENQSDSAVTKAAHVPRLIINDKMIY